MELQKQRSIQPTGNNLNNKELCFYTDANVGMKINSIS